MSRSKLWNSLVNAGVDKEDALSASNIVCRGLNILSISIILINLVCGTFFWYMTSQESILVASAIEITGLAFVILLNKCGDKTAAKHLFLITINLATTYFGLLLGKNVYVTLMAVFLAGVTMFLFTELKNIVCSLAITLVALSVIVYGQKVQVIVPVSMAAGIEETMQNVAVFVIVFIVVVVFKLFADLKNKVIAQQEKIMKKKDVFITTVGHEFARNFAPIQAMITSLGTTSLLENWEITPVSHTKIEEGPESENPKVLYRILYNSCVDYAAFTGGLIDYPRLKSGYYQEPIFMKTDVDRLIRNRCEQHNFQASKKRCTINCQIDRAIRIMYIDKTKVRQILNNLLSNAIEHSMANCQINVVADDHVNYWTLSVTNIGLTIPKEMQETIFRQYTTDQGRENKGVGIGLFVVKELCKELKANYKVTSENGVTTFTVAFKHSSPNIALGTN